LQSFPYGEVLYTPRPDEDQLESYLKGLIFRERTDQLSDESASGYLKDLNQLQMDFNRADEMYRGCMGASLLQGNWFDEISNLNNTQKPVALVYGSEEQIINTHYLAHRIQHKWKDCLQFIPKAGHLNNLDQPELFNQLLHDFATELLTES